MEFNYIQFEITGDSYIPIGSQKQEFSCNRTVLSLLSHCFEQPITKQKKLKQPITIHQKNVAQPVKILKRMKILVCPCCKIQRAPMSNDKDLNNFQFLLHDSSLQNAEDEILNSYDNDLTLSLSFTIDVNSYNIYQHEQLKKFPLTLDSSNSENTADVSRFPVISNNDIEELKSLAVNRIIGSSTEQYSGYNFSKSIATLAIYILKSTLADFDKKHSHNTTRKLNNYELKLHRIMQSALEGRHCSGWITTTTTVSSKFQHDLFGFGSCNQVSHLVS